jgi:hypothetical protein
MSISWLSLAVHVFGARLRTPARVVLTAGAWLACAGAGPGVRLASGAAAGADLALWELLVVLAVATMLIAREGARYSTVMVELR